MSAGGGPTASSSERRDVRDGGHVGRDVLAGAPVAPGGRLHEPPVPVDEGDGQAVDLELADEGGVLGDLLGQPVGPGLELVGAEGVVQAHHRHPVGHRGEQGRGRRSDRRGGRVRDHQVGMFGLDAPQLPHQGVVLGVGDLRVVEPVVAVVVVGDQGPQRPGPGHRIPAVPVASRRPRARSRGGSSGDARTDHLVGTVRGRRGPRSGRGRSRRWGRVEPDHQATLGPPHLDRHRPPVGAALGHEADGAVPSPVGSPSTQVTVCSVTSGAEAASGGPDQHPAGRDVHRGDEPPAAVRGRAPSPAAGPPSPARPPRPSRGRRRSGGRPAGPDGAGSDRPGTGPALRPSG